MNKIIDITTDNAEPTRIDLIILEFFKKDEKLTHITRAQIKTLFKNKKVFLDDKLITKSGILVKANHKIKIHLQVYSNYNFKPYDFPINIIYEDDVLLVVDKPNGLTVHPGAGNQDETLINALVSKNKFSQFTSFENERPGIVHRIDKNTSGLLVIAKNLKAQNILSKQFSDRSVERGYKALAFVTPRSQRIIQKHEEGIINKPIGRSKTKVILMEIDGKASKEAITSYKVIEKMQYAYLLDLKLATGRTHQIRVHLEHISSPLIGDSQYNTGISLPKELEISASRFGRQALHAYKLGFIHPTTNKFLSFESKLPKDFETLIDDFRAYL